MIEATGMTAPGPAAVIAHAAHAVLRIIASVSYTVLLITDALEVT